MFDIINTKLDCKSIDHRRKEVLSAFLQRSPNIREAAITSISSSDLELLYKLYDEIYLEGWFVNAYKGRLRFSLSRRMTKSAGLTLCPRNISRIKPEEVVIEIRIGVDFFFHYGLVGGNKAVCGIKTNSSLEALLLVFEHELCHAIEFINYKKSSCKAQRFKTLAANLFGHTDSCHRLPTNRQIATQKLGLRIGDTVSFDSKGKRLTGIIYNINKRATVMVRNNKGPLMDSRGNRYSKYYVPLSQCQFS